jgi:hypothetical protein
MATKSMDMRDMDMKKTNMNIEIEDDEYRSSDADPN